MLVIRKLGLGAALAVVAGFAFWKYSVGHVDYDYYENMGDTAAMANVDPDAFKALMDLSERVSLGQPLRPAEWETVKRYAVDREKEVRMRAIGIVRTAKGRKYEEEAIQLATSLINDTDEFVAISALSALKELGAQSWVREAQRFLSSASPTLRSQAQTMLNNEDRGSRLAPVRAL